MLLPPCLEPRSGPEILVVAGEASGDLYGADLVHRALELNPSVRFFGMGGDRMAACGVDVVHHIREASVMGFVEVLGQIRRLHRAFRGLVEEARRRQPVAALFIDFPDFNLRLAPKIREATGARTIYYIGPTVWAWRRGRVETVKRAIDRMIVIFPFEVPIYREAGVEVEFVGHPLVGSVKTRIGDAAEFRGRLGIDPGARLVGLLPGSRPKVVEQILPALVAASSRIASARPPGSIAFALGLADTVERSQVEKLLPPGSAIRIVERATPDLMKHADLLLVASGTAPLEAALLGTPMVVVYRATPLTYGIASRLVSVPHICMVNLILERRAVPELLQRDFTPERVAAEARTLLDDEGARSRQQAAFAEFRQRLGAAGASKRAARAVLDAAGLLPEAGALPEAVRALPATAGRRLA